ncbi:helix-turn-helix domain-containing protein [Brooklawnia cerclae]|uniref:Excisionase family DNA binding protein n=1 Tax=Brooklawnia cerclae TaxID=349934 RepID=A0ABX0SKG7_9ACTN|nr:helix-turn-helix domain-containing protein [Brooklawnia cerclae]NIH58480.1 excisionase family DNA binding protein [Brooklawnia cerclae]
MSDEDRRPVTIDDVRGRATIRVWPEAAELLGISKDAAYRAAAAGQIPTLRLGRRLLVPVPKLLEMLGYPV